MKLRSFARASNLKVSARSKTVSINRAMLVLVKKELCNVDVMEWICSSCFEFREWYEENKEKDLILLNPPALPKIFETLLGSEIADFKKFKHSFDGISSRATENGATDGMHVQDVLSSEIVCGVSFATLPQIRQLPCPSRHRRISGKSKYLPLRRVNFEFQS